MARSTSMKSRARKVEKSAARGARRADRTLRGAALNHWLTSAARLGYVIRGLLYAVMGGLALALSLGGSSSTTDQRGVLHAVAGSRAAFFVMAAVVVGIGAYAIWGFTRAVWDPLKRGHDAAGIAARIGFAWSGLNYAAITVVALTFLIGHGNSDDKDSIPHLINRVMSLPAGRIVVIVAGAIGTVAGLGQFVDAYRAGFKKDLNRNRMNAAERNVTDTLGRVGMAARGVIFTLLAWFILQAGLHHDPSRAEGMGATFRSLEGAPMGRVILGLVGLGFIALGLHSGLNARWVRTPRE